MQLKFLALVALLLLPCSCCLALAALLSATAWAAPAANATDGDNAADVPAVDSIAYNSTSTGDIAADSFLRRLKFSVYDDKYFRGSEQQFTNTNGSVDVRFHEDKGCQNMARAFEDSDWDHIWDDDVKKSKYVKVVKVWGA